MSGWPGRHGSSDRRGRVADRRRWAEAGSVTAELAVTLPGVAVLLLVVLLAGVVGAAQVAVQDAARVVARALALGDEASASDGSPTTVTPAAAVIEGQVDVTREGEWVHVVVTREVGVLGVGITVTGRACVLTEPTGRSP